MRAKNRTRSSASIFVVIVGFVCISVALLWSLLTWEETKSDITAYRAERWLNSTYEDILESTDDEDLKVLQAPEIIIEGTMLCVSGRATQVFGTNRPYKQVVASYSRWFKDEDWKMKEMLRQNMTTAYLYYKPTEQWVRYLTLEPYFSKAFSFEYKSVYVIEIFFAESRCTDYRPD